MAQGQLARRGEQRRFATAERRTQSSEIVAPLLQLTEVTAAEFVPALRIVARPAAQRGRRRELFRPGVGLELGPAHAAWPKPVDQDAESVLGAARLIDALDP